MSRRASQRAFTFVELCLAMVITTMVMAAMAAFSMAMVSAWKSADKTQAMTLLGHQAVLRIQNEVRSAKLIGACRVGSSDGSATGAAIMLWKQDTNSDGYIQSTEVEMIIHDTARHKLVLYPIGTSDGAGTWSYASKFSNTATFDTFKAGHPSTDFVQNVYGAVFGTSGTSSATQYPNLQFALKLQIDQTPTGGVSSAAVGGGQEMLVQYGSVTLRAPLNAPSN